MLIGMWAAAEWAIRLYDAHGILRFSHEEKERLLHKYWSAGERQIATSVAFGCKRWSAKAS